MPNTKDPQHIVEALRELQKSKTPLTSRGREACSLIEATAKNGVLSEPGHREAVRILKNRFGVSRGQGIAARRRFAEDCELAVTLIAVAAKASKAQGGEHSTPAEATAQHRPECAQTVGVSELHSAQSYAHTEDFSAVIWQGTEYVFTQTQADVVRVLWEADGLPLRTHHIAEEAGLKEETFQMAHTFRNRIKGKYHRHPAFGTMIQPFGRGLYKIPGLYKLSAERSSQNAP